MYIPNRLVHTDITSTSGDELSTGGWSSLIGIITAICGNILISFALNTQRYAHLRLGRARDLAQEKDKAERRSRNDTPAEEETHKTRESTAEPSDGERQPLIPKLGNRKTSSSTSDTYVEEKDDEETKSYLKSPIWWLGISLMVVGEAGNFLAYGFAPASIVSPLGVVALISNCLIAPLLLHEEFRWRDGVGVIIAIAGCVTVVLSASGSNPKLSQKDIWDLISRWEFETYLGVTALLIIILMFASNRFGDRTVLIDLGLVGLFGGYTALSTKGVASLLSNTVWRAFTFPLTYILIAVLVSTAVLQIKYINRALQRFNSTIVIPTQFVLFTLSVIVGSAVLYRDFERRSAADAGKFIGGCALTFLGVWCITSGRSDDHDDEEDDGNSNQEFPDNEANVTTRNRPSFPRAQSATQQPPALLVSSADDQPTISTQTGLNETIAASAGPANRAAIHSESNTPLLSTAANPRKPPALHATTSEPTVPMLDSSEHVLRPQTPPRRRPSDVYGTSLEPSPQRHRLLGRHSIADLLPGPFMSPLSSSLSAIVADSLRRGVDTPAATLRGKSFRLPRRQTGDPDRMPRQSVATPDLDLEQPESSVSATGRNRSFSTTIGDYFGSALKRPKSHEASSSVRQ